MLPVTTPTPYPCATPAACARPGHDPSALQRTSGGYYLTLVTGSGAGEAFGFKYLDPADYSAGWHQGDASFLVPTWLLDYEPWRSSGCDPACPFWAPDLPSAHAGASDELVMYYSVPAIDGEGSGCIGRATGVFHAPESRGDAASIDWTDAGEPIVCSDATLAAAGGPHNIDPSVMTDADGRSWLSYGSWSSTGATGGGLWAVELDPTTGLLGGAARARCGDAFPYCWSAAADSGFVSIANNPQMGTEYDGTNALEASYLYRHKGAAAQQGGGSGAQQYFLFVNWFWCCRGLESTYEIRVGRSAAPTGPFRDRDGRDMRAGGGTLLVRNVTRGAAHTLVGPGHAGVLEAGGGRYAFTFDLQGVDSDDATRYQTQARELTWDADGWPVVGEANFVPTAPQREAVEAVEAVEAAEATEAVKTAEAEGVSSVEVAVEVTEVETEASVEAAVEALEATGAEAATATFPTVHTSAGTVRGVRLDGASQYLGMRFATSARFEPPVDFTGRYANGTHDGTDFGRACMQVGAAPNVTYGSEDCLVANVWQPAGARPGDRLPVLVFIYGGSWQFGETEPYNGSALAAKHGVVYAALAYRTGPLGFMAFEEDAAAGRATGNWGMQDMQAGLRWLRREVAAFGGDPRRLTIHGQSSGGMAVELHHVMPASHGLLHGIVSESGGLSARPLKTALANTRAAAQAAGCANTTTATTDSGSASTTKACMQRVAAVALTSQTYSLSFEPTVDGVVIPSDPLALLRRGAINPGVGFLAGAQTNDSNRELFPSYEDASGDLMPLSAARYAAAVADDVGAANADTVLALYPPVRAAETAGATADLRLNVHSLGRISSDRMLCSAARRLRYFGRGNSGGNGTARAAFLYRFNYWYRSNARCAAEPNWHAPSLGAVHEDEITFVMGQPIFMFDGSCCGVFGSHAGTTEPCAAKRECTACFAPERFGADGYAPYFDAKELAFSELVGRYWTNFASSQDPNRRRDYDRASGRYFDRRVGGGDARWPEASTARNLVLDANLDGHAAAEGTLYGDGRVCALWDEIDGAELGAEARGVALA